MNNDLASSAGKNRHLSNKNDEIVAQPIYGSKAGEDADIEIDLKGLFNILLRRKLTILLITLLIMTVALVRTLMIQPIYRASTTLQVSPATKVLNYDVEADGGAARTRDFYSTQFQILKSRALAKRTIDSMGLEGSLQGERLAKPFFAETISGLKSAFFGDEDVDLEGADSDVVMPMSKVGSPPVERHIIANLTVSPVRNSQIISLSYDSPDPQLAANIINSIAANILS